MSRDPSFNQPAAAGAAVSVEGSGTAVGQTQDWRILLAIFCVTSAVEGLGVNQIFAFAPTYLTQMGVADADRLHFIGIFSALIFVVGAPLVPLWGVWADKYSRKAVIVRSALVEAVVFLKDVLKRMERHQSKETALLGPLHSWRDLAIKSDGARP